MITHHPVKHCHPPQTSSISASRKIPKINNWKIKTKQIQTNRKGSRLNLSIALVEKRVRQYSCVWYGQSRSIVWEVVGHLVQCEESNQVKQLWENIQRGIKAGSNEHWGTTLFPEIIKFGSQESQFGNCMQDISRRRQCLGRTVMKVTDAWYQNILEPGSAWFNDGMYQCEIPMFWLLLPE